ncbi:hypothetical protein NM208_g8266 [Fusarium decemcellulare]|uniref:Uncharacterized protein n=1 Tax=Fusarium decemcellulare TaxID=57161 RepID=A0ACC1S6J7_9HYPO|nr:hypothetical protein NM208_g8266 [Fusarium decemcellulare]
MDDNQSSCYGRPSNIDDQETGNYHALSGVPGDPLPWQPPGSTSGGGVPFHWDSLPKRTNNIGQILRGIDQVMGSRQYSIPINAQLDAIPTGLFSSQFPSLYNGSQTSAVLSLNRPFTSPATSIQDVYTQDWSTNLDVSQSDTTLPPTDTHHQATTGLLDEDFHQHGFVKRQSPTPYLVMCASHPCKEKGKTKCPGRKCETISNWTETEMDDPVHRGPSICLRCFTYFDTKRELKMHITAIPVCQRRFQRESWKKMRHIYEAFCSTTVPPQWPTTSNTTPSGSMPSRQLPLLLPNVGKSQGLSTLRPDQASHGLNPATPNTSTSQPSFDYEEDDFRGVGSSFGLGGVPWGQDEFSNWDASSLQGPETNGQEPTSDLGSSWLTGGHLGTMF